MITKRRYNTNCSKESTKANEEQRDSNLYALNGLYTLSRKLAPATRQLISSTLSRTIPSFSLNRSANLKAPPPVAFRNILNQIVDPYIYLINPKTRFYDWLESNVREGKMSSKFSLRSQDIQIPFLLLLAEMGKKSSSCDWRSLSEA